MRFFVSPFKKHQVGDFEGVYRPLDWSTRHPSTLAFHDARLKVFREEASSGLSEDGMSPGSSKSSGSAKDPYSPYTIEGLRAEVVYDMIQSGLDSVYDRKSMIINKAIQDIGMGRYQKNLFFMCGFGWLADNLWLQGLAVTIPQLSAEFDLPLTRVRYTTFAMAVGLCIGALSWGIASDKFGRRIPFNFTLLLAGVCGISLFAGNSWEVVCATYAFLGVGVGGSMPVDGSIFLEFLPTSHTHLLTLLSMWWGIGQLIASALSIALINHFSCQNSDGRFLPSCTHNAAPCCSSKNNKGWRYFNLVLGILTIGMFCARIFAFHLFESPKYLVSKGRQAEAVAVVHGIAYRNGRETWLSEHILDEVGGVIETEEKPQSSQGIFRNVACRFSAAHFRTLFSTKRLGIMTALIWLTWALIGMGYTLYNAFLPQYLANAGSSRTVWEQSRDFLIIAAVGFPGSFLGWWLVKIPWLGRKFTIAPATLIAGVLLIIFPLNPNPNVQTGLGALSNFFQNIMYGVLYAYTPEVFPARSRGTATGIASCLNRFMGMLAPIIGANTMSGNPNIPVFVSGALIVVAGFAMICFPIETQGRQSL